MEQDDNTEDSSIDQLRQRYRLEQQKRLRPEGMAQYRELTEDLDRDLFVSAWLHPGTGGRRGNRRDRGWRIRRDAHRD